MWSLTIVVIVFSTFLTPLINALNWDDDWDSFSVENDFSSQESTFRVTASTDSSSVEKDFSSQESIFQKRKFIALNLSSNPQFSINIETNSTSYFVNVSNHLKTEWRNERVKMNLIIEELSGSSLNSDDSRLYIKGTKWSIKLWQDVDNTKNKFQSVSEAYDNEKQFEIIPEGNWGNDTITARVVVSVYIERNSCEDCPQNFFCCGAMSNSCTSTFLTHNKTNLHANEKVRCIPKEPGTQGLLCNDHPNCGFYCNPDENKNFCENGSYYEDNNPQTADVVWLVILFFIATLLIIASVIICVCFMMYIHQNGGCYNLLFKSKPEGSKGKGNVSSTAHKNAAYTKEPEESFRYSSEYI